MKRLLALLALLAPLLAPLLVLPPAQAQVRAQVRAQSQAQAGTVLETRVIGHSVQGRPIRAYHLGEPGKPVVVVIATMHGDETASRRILLSLVHGTPVRGVDLWLVPTYNPDGAAHHRRVNAHGVDLNRNYPYKWQRLTGHYNSGPRPASEPETKAMMAFLQQVRPLRVVSFHQPLHGIDIDTKQRAFARRLAHFLQLPVKRFECGGACHGTMTMWFNHGFAGGALTAEYGAHPSRREMTKQAPRRLLRAIHATR
ncbi:DUF2817 domain-containing protein [Nocardioides mangrovicus]|uniref:DUF2817 domain-containing protein n=1 Tax=Nocardioides mangrovicus TaxID=2478913 RepID=A0A3L8NVY2_9ACTN|nr:DUF2817 domain-containing protein [Nocardioides mangrovicus]RLV47486.1 DUF2817 domain-containing protein [Nocardioides mangrovicus]